MSWRTVVVSSRAKLELKLNSMIIRTGEDIKKVFIGELNTVIIESTAVSLTAALLSELAKHKVKVIFCDEKRNPESELISYYGSHDTSNKLRTQIAWPDCVKETIWTHIVTEKIVNQRNLLLNLGCAEAAMLSNYINEIQYNDSTNREGHAAKVYFNALWGKDFSRKQDNDINAALNYGYSIILSTFNREICALGYSTQLGLFHDNMFNQFNLSCDLMEPFRPFVDSIVLNMHIKQFGKEEKIKLVNILNEEVIINEKKQLLNNAIKIYCKSVFDALNGNDAQLIRFVRNEL